MQVTQTHECVKFKRNGCPHVVPVQDTSASPRKLVEIQFALLTQELGSWSSEICSNKSQVTLMLTQVQNQKEECGDLVSCAHSAICSLCDPEIDIITSSSLPLALCKDKMERMCPLLVNDM